MGVVLKSIVRRDGGRYLCVQGDNGIEITEPAVEFVQQQHTNLCPQQVLSPTSHAAATAAAAAAAAPPPRRSLREHLLACEIPVSGRWADAGDRYIGDRIPADKWLCRTLEVLDLDNDEPTTARSKSSARPRPRPGAGASGSDEVSDNAVWRRARELRALERKDPVLLRSRRIKGARSDFLPSHRCYCMS